MNYKIELEHMKVLELILPFFVHGEVIDVKKCIRDALKRDPYGLNRMPINLYSDIITEFLIEHKFAKSLAGDAVVKRKGIVLKDAGSLLRFERLKYDIHDFIIIDDDDINNDICKKVIQFASPSSTVKTFTDPNLGLRYMYSLSQGVEFNSIVVLLDIAMPTLLGWDVLDEFDSFPEAVKTRFRVYMLSCSVDQRDWVRAENHFNVWGYIEKPLTERNVKQTLMYE